MSLPSPRTFEQGIRDIMVNAINMMSAEDLKAVHREIGPFCLEVILNATTPRPVEVPAEIEKSADRPPQDRKRGSYAPQHEAEELVARLRDFLGDDGWTEPSLREVFRHTGGHKTAAALLNAKPGYRLTVSAAKAIEEFLK